jgi:predicted AlkP superfamily phosphohydrolase/phosphomutase
VSRLFVLGVDGLPPTVFRRFADEGVLPNCTRLLKSAALLDVIPTLPPITAPGWLTIASGAHPVTLGVTGILQPVPGTAPDTVQNGFDRTLSRAEYIWETLTRVGLPAIVLKYPGSWPPRADGIVQVDGGGGYADITCPFELVPSAAYVSAPQRAREVTPSAVPTGYGEHWRIDSGGSGGQVPATLREPVGWEGIPPDCNPVFETVLDLQPRGQRRKDPLRALACERDGEPILVIANAKSWRQRLAELRVGDWSEWIVRDAARGAYALRLKLLTLDPAGRRLHVYRSEGHRTDGFTVPAELAGELLSAVGPVVEWTGTFDFMNGLIDLETQLELYAAHTAWLQRAVEHLARRPWHGFFMHWHVVEYAHHIAGAALDGHHHMPAAERRRYLDFLRNTYRLLDELVGTVLRAAGEEVALALVSDHGHDLVHTLFHVNEFLRAHGWLAIEEVENTVRVDWSRTSAYGLFPGQIVLNRRNRWAGGTISDAEALKLCAEIDAGLRSVTDPRSDRAVVTAVLDRDAMATFGQGGEHAPDLFFTLDRGYEVATRLTADGRTQFAGTKPGSELTSGHGSFHPHSASARTLALLRDTTIARDSHARAPVAMADLAPTFAALMEIEPPSDADGCALDLQALGVASR